MLFKIRASQAGKIMVGNIGLTEAQEVELELLSTKPTLTAIQAEKRANLAYKKLNPELPKTLKSYCEGWLKEQLYHRRKSIYSKYLEKGNIMEDNSIETISRHLNIGLVFKNEQYFEDEYFTGTPDILLSDLVIDAKNSWDFTTFPLFSNEIPNEDYFYQLQVYMHLTGRNKSKLCYVLSDTPEALIESEARRYCFSLGMDETPEDIFQAFVEKLTYPDVSENMKIKCYDIEYSQDIIEELKKRVELCRSYIKTLWYE